MPSAAGLVKKADALLRRFNATDRVVYKRTLVREGGDPLIGSPASVTSTDVVFDPQPAISRAIPQPQTARGHRNDPMLLFSGVANPATDYLLLSTPTGITVDELSDKDVSIVFKDAAGREEQLSIVIYDEAAYQGQDIVFSILIRSRKQ